MDSHGNVHDPAHDQPLTFGGTLSFTQPADDEYRLRIDGDDGEHLELRLSALDLWGIRARTGDLVMDRMRKPTPAVGA